MSFTSIVKNEVSKLPMVETDNLAELSAILRNLGTFLDAIKIMTENASVARRIFNLIKDTYHIHAKITVRKGYNFNKNYIYLLEITHKKEFILEDLSIFTEKHFESVPKTYLVDDQDLVRAYLRGLFLSVGSVNDPKKSRYHLEFLVDWLDYAKFIQSLLNQYELNSKILKRENKYMVYVKEAEKIGDFLRIISASNAVMYYEDIRIYRDHKNMTNRLNNCEQANVDKLIATSNEQIRDIETILACGGLILLDEKEQVVATYRQKYPDASLLELSEIISMETGRQITKSGLHHRFRKIKDLANRLRSKQA